MVSRDSQPPTEAGADESQPARAKDEISNRTTTVVIAQRHQLDIDGLCAVLENRERQVVATTRSGVEVIEICADLRPDIAVLDVSLEGINGIEACRRIQRLELPTRVVMLTSYDDEDTVTNAIAAGAGGFLSKDADRSELEIAIQAVADGQAYLHPPSARRFLSRVAPMANKALAEGRLTDRELDVLELLAEGRSTRSIAAALFLGEETVKSHLARIYHKLGANDRVQAVAIAIRRGLVP